MTTTVAKTGAIQGAPARARRSQRRMLTSAAIILALAAVAVGAWLLVARVAGERATPPVTAATRIPVSTPSAPAWLEHLEVINEKKELVRAGYAIKVDANLDPVTKSALADYLRLDSAHPLSPFLAGALTGTVITGFRNPTAWNSRFGLHRLTKFVERPLTGPGGQLDANGNLRVP